MTIPATPDFFAVQNVFQLRSGLPEDVVVNTFIMRNNNVAGNTVGGTPQERAAAAVRDFFIAAAPELPNSATTGFATLSAALSQVVNGWTQKVYDLGRPPGGRVPQVFDRTTDLGTLHSTSLPPELACVLSLQTNVIGRRGKGRLFLGPLGLNVLAATPGTMPVLNNFFINRVRAQAARLLTGNGQDMGWAVYSPTRNKMADVIGGSVDNAFDVQRRRGTKATARTTFGSTVPSVLP